MKNAFRSAAFALLIVPFSHAIADQPPGDDTKTEAILIDLIKNSPDAESRLKLLNAMVKGLPAESATWAFEQIYQVYEETGQVDKALETGEKILSLDPEDIEIAYKCLRIARQKGDPAVVRKWSRMSAQTAACVLASPKDDETGRRRLEYARQVGNSIGYLKYREIAAVQDPGKRLELIDDFLQSDKDSEYRHAAESLYLSTCCAGNARKAQAAAEKILKLDENNEDALLIVAESYQDSQMDPQKLTGYANRLLAAMTKKTKPVELTDDQWAKKKARLTGASYWMIGSALLQQSHYGSADKSIRTALPYLKGDARLMSAALFYLGWANYQMHNFPEAIRFNQQCMALKGPYQEKAAKNLEVIRAETDH